MEGNPALYLGRIVSKENFRAFIYSPDGSKKLVNSWVDFENHMKTGIWFSSLEDIKCIKESKKKKTKDDFLPKD